MVYSAQRAGESETFHLNLLFSSQRKQGQGGALEIDPREGHRSKSKPIAIAIAITDEQPRAHAGAHAPGAFAEATGTRYGNDRRNQIPQLHLSQPFSNHRGKPS